MDAIVEIKSKAHLIINVHIMANTAYKAVVSAPSKPDKKQFDIAETTFKKQFRNYINDFHHK